MANRKGQKHMNVKIIKEQRLVEKADTTTQLEPTEINSAGDWISPPIDMKGMENLVQHSTILPQCIRAYKNNIAGFGIGVRYKDDREETSEMAAEFEQMKRLIELLNTEQDTKEIFEDIIEARETYGIAYLEVIRNIAGEVTQIEFIKETTSVVKSQPIDPYLDTIVWYNTEAVPRKKRFCKYKQQVGGKTVYFREFGDPRMMDNRDGRYLEAGETIELPYHANEILEFAIGTKPYGEVRWAGQILGVDGSRKAENLNNNYFENGRHTPLMIMIKGGTLTPDSYEKLQAYMNDIKGEAGQHAFIVLETESTDSRADFDQTEKPEIEIKDLASILQKDELFQDYLNNNRQKVQSAFQLPDLYIGYMRDFNRATAQTAQVITEQQVFQPERKSLAWIINNQLLNDYKFKYVEAYFKEPDISNPDDLYKLLTVCNNAGGLTPNKAKSIIFEAYGETPEDYPEEWGDVPLAYNKKQKTNKGLDLDHLNTNFEKQIEKAAGNHEAAVVSVLEEIRNCLLEMSG